MATTKVAAQGWELYVTVPAGAEHQVLNLKSSGPAADSATKQDTSDFTLGAFRQHMKIATGTTIPFSCWWMEDGGAFDAGQGDILTLGRDHGSAGVGSFRWVSPEGYELAGDGTVVLTGYGGGSYEGVSELNFEVECTEEWT